MAGKTKNVQFKLLKKGTTFSLATAEGIRKFLVYSKASKTRAVCVGFFCGYSSHHVRVLISYQGERIQVKADELVSVH